MVVRPALAREVCRLVNCGIRNVFRDFIDEVVCGFALVRDTESLADVGEAHDPESDRAVFLVGLVGFVHRRASDVDEVVELANRDACGFVHLYPVEFSVNKVRREVDRGEVADRDVFGVLWKADFGAQVRRVNRAGVVVQCTKVDRVLPGQPRVRRRLQRNEDLLELLACGNLLEEVEFTLFGHRNVLGVPSRECGAIQFVQVSDLERVEEVPVAVILNALHELVGNPDGRVRGAGATVGVARVLTKVEEFGEVEVPVLHVEAERAELLATSRNRTKNRVDGVHERNRTGRHRVVRTDRRALSAKLRHREADSTRSLSEPHDVASGLGDVLDVVLHFENEAVRELRVRRARVDERRAGRQIFERRHLAVEPQCDLGGVLLVEREPHSDAHPEVLGNLEGVAVAALDSVAVVERDDTDVFEQSVVSRFEFGGERLEVEHLYEARIEEPFVNTAADVGLEVFGVKCFEFVGRRVIAEDALINGLEQQSRRDGVESRVVLDVLEGDLDDGFVELLRGNSIEQCQFEFGADLRDPGKLVGEALCGFFDGEVNLVRVVWFACSIAFDNRDVHRCPSLRLPGFCRRDGKKTPNRWCNGLARKHYIYASAKSKNPIYCGVSYTIGDNLSTLSTG